MWQNKELLDIETKVTVNNTRVEIQYKPCLTYRAKIHCSQVLSYRK